MKLIGSKVIETERLVLRPSSMKEQKRLWEILMIPDVNKWYLTSAKKHANNPSHWTWDNQEKFYKSKVDNANNGDVFCWSIFLKKEYTNSKKEEVIGQVSAQEEGEDITIRDVGWFIDPIYQGKGYATEAAKSMIDYMFNEVEINKISSSAVKDNIGSCKIFEKLGFIKIGEEEKESPYTFYDGTLTLSKYELDKEDYSSIGYQEYYIESNGKSNCVVRTLCKILDKEYEEVYNELTRLANEENASYNDVCVFEKYMQKNNIHKISFNEDIRVKDLGLDNAAYIVLCYDKKDYYHMIPIINNIIYDKNNDCINLYVVDIYKKH